MQFNLLQFIKITVFRIDLDRFECIKINPGEFYLHYFFVMLRYVFQQSGAPIRASTIHIITNWNCGTEDRLKSET